MKKKILFLLICLVAFATKVNALDYDKAFEIIAPGGTITMQAIKPTDDFEADSYITEIYAYSFFHSKEYAQLQSLLTEEERKTKEVILSANYNVDGYEKLTITVNICNKETWGAIENKNKTVNVKWQDTDPVIKADVDQKLKKLKDLMTIGEEGYKNPYYFNLYDLNLINYYANKNNNNPYESLGDSYNVYKYSNDMKTVFGDANYSYSLDARAGDLVTIFYGPCFGYLRVLYNNIIYGAVEPAGIKTKNILYIPEDTENTKEAYIAAAQKRIDDYLGAGKATVSVGGLIADYDFTVSYLEDSDIHFFGDPNKMGDYYYKITYSNNNHETYFLFIRDAKANDVPVSKNSDIRTNVTIETASPEVPLDSVIQVKQIEEGSEDYVKLTSDLNINNAVVYDLKVFSSSLNDYISKVSNGNFKVSVPINDSLKGKKLAAYYIADDGTVETYDVEIVDDKAVFTTNHFSVYTIGEVAGEEVPNTNDNMVIYLVSTLGAMGSLIATGYYINKKIKNI